MIQALVCDDYEPIVSLITVVLEGMGMTVTRAVDGKEALDLARRLRPGLIISDIDMPRLDGLSLFANLQSDPSGLAGVPFILMSSIDRWREAREAGCSYFLTKPFSIEELRSTVQEALSGGHSPN